MSNSVHNRLTHSATHRSRYADLAVPQSPVCGTPESTGFGTLAAKESHLMVQQADEHRAEDEGEHPIHERKHRGNFNGLSGKREGNHPDRGTRESTNKTARRTSPKRIRSDLRSPRTAPLLMPKPLSLHRGKFLPIRDLGAALP